MCKWDVLGFHESDHLPCVALVKKKGNARGHQLRRTIIYDNTSDDITSRIRLPTFKTYTQWKPWSRPPWWNMEVDKFWKEKRKAVRKWQKARKTGNSLDLKA
uniref:Uncharacterized protein n=1 Tax=Arion vulgaris TaxID=1028688 RepID=A0A0B7AN51_9EUPU